MTGLPKQEPTEGYDQQALIDKVLADVQRRTELYNDAIERVMHVMMLNTALTSFKDLGEQMKHISSQVNLGSPMILHPAVSGEAFAVFQLGQTLFPILDDTSRPEDDFQKVAGMRPSEVDAIDLTEANLPYIVPRDPNKTGSQVVVKLSDLDQFRLDEAQKLTQLVSGDKGAIDIVRPQMGGYRADPIFPKDSV